MSAHTQESISKRSEAGKEVRQYVYTCNGEIMELSSAIIKKYSKYSVAELLKKCQVFFNKYIRERDKDLPCVNCGKFRKLQAGHFFPTSTHSILRFHEDNAHGECLQCNYFNSQSHSYGYRKEIEKRIGKDRFEMLELSARMRGKHKWNRETLIHLIETYKLKSK